MQIVVIIFVQLEQNNSHEVYRDVNHYMIFQTHLFKQTDLRSEEIEFGFLSIV